MRLMEIPQQISMDYPSCVHTIRFLPNPNWDHKEAWKQRTTLLSNFNGRVKVAFENFCFSSNRCCCRRTG
ncbi:hypothetical protein EG68_05545 [Paragonimus skrjabini miyazakii]|uniref:Uncharacterized protein n=1 Tax=Paragonimus skrjabini miyazakii TaxID=59628 RepID=A0A8S9YW66_9TREM|nr:hypothetical protein EG68_05545 [Paragonimus skrjabini miyazakii]